MATLHQYRCTHCGYSVESEPAGHYVIMTGEVFLFNCHHCKEVVSILAEEIRPFSFLSCPQCGANSDRLYMWNPTEGKCPKCGGKMKKSEVVIMAD